MGRSVHIIVLALALPAVIVACDDDEPSAEDAWSRNFAEAACAAMYQGCECPTELPWSSANVCEQSLVPSTRTNQNKAKAAGLVYDADCAERLIDAVAALECETTDEVDMRAEGLTCQVYHGDKQFDEACELITNSSSDCEQGLVCAYQGRRCAHPEHPFVDLEEGAACVDDNNSLLGACPPTQSCDFGTKVCATRAPLGEACSGDTAPCVDGWCDDGTCVVRKDGGEACTSGRECKSVMCSNDVCAPEGPTPLACLASGL